MYKKIIYRTNFMTWLLAFVLISVIVACGVVYFVPEYKHATGNFIAEHMSDKFAEQKSTIVELGETIDENDETITSLRSTITTKQVEITRLSAVNITLTQEKNVLNSNLVELELEIEELDNSIAELDEDYDDLLAERNLLQSEYDDLFVEFEDLEYQIILNENSISSLIAERDLLQSEIDELTLDNVALQNRVDELETELSNALPDTDVLSMEDYYSFGVLVGCSSNFLTSKFIDADYIQFVGNTLYSMYFEESLMTVNTSYFSAFGCVFVRYNSTFFTNSFVEDCIDDSNLLNTHIENYGEPVLYVYNIQDSLVILVGCYSLIDENSSMYGFDISNWEQHSVDSHYDFNNNCICDFCLHNSCVDVNDDCLCDNCGDICHRDLNHDCICDICSAETHYCFGSYPVCFYCNEFLPHEHVDEDNNYICDICWNSIPHNCVDENTDYICDICGVELAILPSDFGS